MAITLDINMPEVDGWKLLTLLKSDKETAGIPVIIISMMEDRKRGYTLGAAEYLTKPVDRALLVQLLSSFQNRGRASHALIVDDDADARTLLAGLLTAEGWAVSEAADGNAGLEQIKSIKPDLVLLDLQMPEMNGFEVLDKIRSDDRLRDLPVVIVTARDLTSEEWTQLSAGAQQILQKGTVSREELLDSLMDVVNEKAQKKNAAAALPVVTES